MDPLIVSILIGIGKGLVFGAIAAGIGFLKDEDFSWDNFDKKSFVKTMLIGAFLGGISGGLAVNGMTFDEACAKLGDEFGIPGTIVQTAIMTGLTMLADEIVKLIWRRFKLGKLCQKIKALIA